MKTLSDLKRRLMVGVKAKITWSKYPNHKYLYKPRAVKAVWSTGVLWDGNSELRWGKASNYQFNPERPDCFTVLENGDPILSYRILEEGVEIVNGLAPATFEKSQQPPAICVAVGVKNRSE